MKSLLVFMLLWIGDNTNYNTDLIHPKVIFVSEQVLGEMYGGRTTSATSLKAFYNTKTDVIYLKDEWDIHSPWDKGVLFHELLHYVQDQNNIKVDCVQQYEKEAYPLQKKYLLQVHGLVWNYDQLWYKVVSTCPTN